MQIKVIIREGIAEAVLGPKGTEIPDIEIIDVNKDYEDYRALADYADQQYAEMEEKPFTVASFRED